MMLLGLFVGGLARRMGGHPKGLLPAPDTGEPLVVRLDRIGRAVGLEPVLVGDAAPYRSALPALRVIADDPPGIGPLGGLGGLLAAAGDGRTLALACDLPYVSEALVARLVADASAAPVLAPRASALSVWEPLCARYDAKVVRPALDRLLAKGGRSFQQLLATLTVAELALGPDERTQLRDWDTPEDVPLAARPRDQ